MLAASFAADVPLFIASPTSDWASAGASFVPSPVIATRWPSACCARMKRDLRPRASPAAMKSSTPASRAIVAAVRGLSPVIITVLMPILPELGEALDEPLLDGVLELDQAEDAAVGPDRERRRAEIGDRVGLREDLRRHRAVEVGADRVDRALEDHPAVGRPDAAGPGLGTERDLLGDRRPELREAGFVAGARRAARAPGAAARASVDDGAALRRLVADRRDERGAHARSPQRRPGPA